MDTFRNLSIRKKLMLLITVTALISVLIGCTTLWIYQVLHYRSTLETEESAMAQLIAESSAPALLFNDARSANETLAVLRADARIETACLYDARAHIVAHFQSGSWAAKCPEGEALYTHFSRSHLFIFRSIQLKGELVGDIYLAVSLTEMYQLLLHFGEIATLVLFMTSIFAFVLSSFLERVISTPIIHLTRIASQVSDQGNYLARAQHFSNDETGLLINQFNSMMDRIQQRDADLQQAQTGLEDKVELRTVDLRNEIVERKQIERDLVTAKVEAEESNRAKSTFLANMSHELRTPLNAIIGYTEMLHEDAEATGDTETREDLARILLSARHLLILISEVLDLSKIEAGQMKISLELSLASSLLCEVVSTAEILAKQNHNTVHISDQMWEGLMLVDPFRFRQCLLNLISNACKFTENGDITITVEKRREDNQDWILWSVCDTGIGIASEALGKLFGSFSQVDSSTTRRHGGSGLGLAISRRLCRAMNGDVVVESAPDVGSTFTIRIPAYAPPLS